MVYPTICRPKKPALESPFTPPLIMIIVIDDGIIYFLEVPYSLSSTRTEEWKRGFPDTVKSQKLELIFE